MSPARHPRTGARIAVPALAAALLLAAAAPADARLIVGTPGPDRLTATSASGDVLVGGGGADTLRGGPGDDRIHGVRAGNTITGGGGNDYVEGGQGDDRIDAGPGNNTVLGGSGHDVITAADGNNWVDAGGTATRVTLGDGDNVLHTGSGGGTYRLGDGANVVYYGSGRASIVLGSGPNVVFANSGSAVGSIDCGGNPASRVVLNPERERAGINNRNSLAAGAIRNCPNVEYRSRPREMVVPRAQIRRGFSRFALRGTQKQADRLLGGHGGGRIDGRGGDNVLWADHLRASGGARARSRTTTITAANGDNLVYGGRGTTIVRLGSGDNLVRGGSGANRITTNGGDNVVRLSGRGRNAVSFRGGRNYVESFTSKGSPRPTIRCSRGARATVVHGRTRPRSSCGRLISAYTAGGRRAQAANVLPVRLSVSHFEGRPAPGENGVGVPRPGSPAA